jgi:hypothetical protein
MKILFLDIDGVLNSTRTANPRKLPYIVEQNLLTRFKTILKRTGAKVVLSSTWRYDPAGLFSAKHHGIPFIGVTPDMPRRPRRDEILAWLKKHPKVTRFAVIDDDDDELDELPLFQPSASKGLDARIANGVINYINGQTEKDMRKNYLRRLVENARAVVKGHIG